MLSSILLASSASANPLSGDRPSRRRSSPRQIRSDIGLVLEEAARNSTNECDIHLQIVHVQDSTDTFHEDFDEMKEADTIKQLVEHLQSTYGPTEYTMAIFHDKEMPMTGHGISGGWWDADRWNTFLDGHGQTNVCYDLLGDFTSDPDSAQGRFNRIAVNGGKDFMENQWDAMLKAAMDPSIEWDLRDYDDDGLPIVRIVLLVTDDGAHTAEATFADNVRNPNREWFRQSGPWSNNLDNIYQKCDLEASRLLTNNINQEYGNLTTGEASGADMGGDGACWGWNYQKAGALRSLKGSLALMEFFYGFGEDDEMIGQVECGPQLQGENCHKYWSFSHCCTAWGLTYRPGSCDADSEHINYFPDFDACKTYGGRFARCHPEMLNDFGGYTGPSDHPMSRAKACIEDSPQWTAAQLVEPTAEFFKGLDWILSPSFIDDIVEYPYADPFSIDCEEHEYPDPRDSRYTDALASLKIHPIIVAAPPSDKLVADPSSQFINSYDVSALRMSGNNCPGLEHDPWTSYTCNASLFGMYYCYNPLDYPQFYPYSQSDAGLWMFDDASSWWRTRCDGQDCADQWWTQCMEVEYKEILDAMPLTTTFQFMPPNHVPEVIIEAVSMAINDAVQSVQCPTTDEPPTLFTTTDDMCPSVECCPTCICDCGCDDDFFSTTANSSTTMFPI